MWSFQSIQEIILSTLSLSGILFFLWQFVAGRCFLASKRTDTSKQTEGPTVFPDVSILKPVGSFNSDTQRCIESWFQLAYPAKIEILLGYQAEDVNTRKKLEQILFKYPEIPAILVASHIEDDENPKVRKLISMAHHATHNTWVVSDADVIAPSDLLIDVIPSLPEEIPSLICFPYRILNQSTLPQKLECAANNIDFWSQVTQAMHLGSMDFAIGATMVFHKKSLEQAGGFESLRNMLADDFHLGQNMVAAGGHIYFIPRILDCLHGNSNFKEIIQRQIRWARTIRNCKPVPYFLSILANPTLWPMLNVLVSPTSPIAFLILTLVVVIRITLAHNLLLHFQGRHKLTYLAWLAPVRDILQSFIWFLAFTGKTIVWNGKPYRLRRDGTLGKS